MALSASSSLRATCRTSSHKWPASMSSSAASTWSCSIVRRFDFPPAASAARHARRVRFRTKLSTDMLRVLATYEAPKKESVLAAIANRSRERWLPRRQCADGKMCLRAPTSRRESPPLWKPKSQRKAQAHIDVARRLFDGCTRTTLNRNSS